MSEYDEPTDASVDGADDATDERADTTESDSWDAPSTGVEAVDEVLASVQRLDGRPVEEHVAVFEQAHERLRRALDPGHG